MKGVIVSVDLVPVSNEVYIGVGQPYIATFQVGERRISVRRVWTSDNQLHKIGDVIDVDVDLWDYYAKQ